MGVAVPVRPAVSHRARQRRLIALGVVVAVLAISNVMSNRILPSWAYVPWNLSMAFVLLGIAYRGGAGPVAVGLGIRHWHRPVGVGLLLFGGTALLIVVGVALDTVQQIEGHLISRNYEGFAGARGPRIRGRLRPAA